MTDPRLTRTRTHFICQLCVDWVENEQAYEDLNGDKWDVCAPCGIVDDQHRGGPLGPGPMDIDVTEEQNFVHHCIQFHGMTDETWFNVMTTRGYHDYLHSKGKHNHVHRKQEER